jgi:hypothetical protein
LNKHTVKGRAVALHAYLASPLKNGNVGNGLPVCVVVPCHISKFAPNIVYTYFTSTPDPYKGR